MRSFVVIALAATLLLACSGIPRAYDGPRRDSGEVAIVRAQPWEPSFEIEIISVDGMEVRGDSVEVLPGPHSLVVQLVVVQITEEEAVQYHE